MINIFNSQVYDSVEKPGKNAIHRYKSLYGGYVEIEKKTTQVWANLEANGYWPSLRNYISNTLYGRENLMVGND